MPPGTKTHHTATATAVMVVALFALATMEAAQDRPRAPASFEGSWTLDLYLSDHPEQVARALRLDTGEGAEDITGGMAERGGVGRGDVGAAPRVASAVPEQRVVRRESPSARAIGSCWRN